jgi:hypothetical protein
MLYICMYVCLCIDFMQVKNQALLIFYNSSLSTMSNMLFDQVAAYIYDKGRQRQKKIQIRSFLGERLSQCICTKYRRIN